MKMDIINIIGTKIKFGATVSFAFKKIRATDFYCFVVFLSHWN
jgi:hypothetical protein